MQTNMNKKVPVILDHHSKEAIANLDKIRKEMQTLLNPHSVENLVCDFSDDINMDYLTLMLNMREISPINFVQINDQIKEFSDRVKIKVN